MIKELEDLLKNAEANINRTEKAAACFIPKEPWLDANKKIVDLCLAMDSALWVLRDNQGYDDFLSMIRRIVKPTQLTVVE